MSWSPAPLYIPSSSPAFLTVKGSYFAPFAKFKVQRKIGKRVEGAHFVILSSNYFSERISPEEKTLANSWPDELKLKKIDDNLLDDEDDFYDDDYEEDDDLYDDEDEDDYYDDEEYYEDEYNDEDGKV